VFIVRCTHLQGRVDSGSARRSFAACELGNYQVSSTLLLSLKGAHVSQEKSCFTDNLNFFIYFFHHSVAQDLDEPWPLEVIGHDGRAANVTMEPGTYNGVVSATIAIDLENEMLTTSSPLNCMFQVIWFYMNHIVSSMVVPGL
jgi:hypothetical protein